MDWSQLWNVTCLASLRLGDVGIPEPGLQEEGGTGQGMWVKIVVEGRAASWLGQLQTHGLGHQGYNCRPFVQSLMSQKSATADAPVEIWAELDGPHTSGCLLLLKSLCVPNY